MAHSGQVKVIASIILFKTYDINGVMNVKQFTLTIHDYIST